MTSFLPHYIKFPNSCVVPALILPLLLSPNAFAETTATSEWNISADKITRLDNPQRIIAEGNIILKKREKSLPPVQDDKTTQVSDWAELLEETPDQPAPSPEELPEKPQPQYSTKAVIKADWISYDVEKQTIHAKGNVSIKSADDHMVAESGRLNLTDQTGFFTDSVITRKEHELHLEGDKVEKTGEKTYRIEDGWVITCKLDEGEVPPWSFASKEATVELGGYAVLKHARFNIRNVPVFYTPYLVVPVKNQRQTGFLFPEFSNSDRDGFGLNIPFFVNISDSTDATLYPEYYSDRGFMPGAEFRYTLSSDTKGRFMGSYLDDDLSDPDNTSYYAETGFTHTNSERYWIRGKSDHKLGNNWIARLDIDVVSDRDYLEEFSSGVTGYNETKESFLETFGRSFENQSDDRRKNTLKFLKPWSGSSLNIDFLAINDVRANKTDPTPLWKLPSVDYTGTLPLNSTSFTFEWDADYVNYWREEGVGGHRLDLFPRLSTPVPVGPYLESRAEIGGRGTLYYVDTYGDATWSEDDTPTRFLPTFETEVATTLVRDFALGNEDSNAKFTRLNHKIRPFIEYDYIMEDDDQDELPSFDSVDRISEKNAITYGVDSFFDLYDKDNDSKRYGYIRIEQSYDLRSENSDEPFSPITLKLGWNPIKRMSLEYKTLIPIEDDQNTTHGFEGYYTNSRGDYFSLDYRYNENQDIEQINGSMEVRILPKVGAAFDIEHSISEGETNEALLSLTYYAQCWSVELQAQDTPTDERFMLVFNLANIGSSLGVNL